MQDVQHETLRSSFARSVSSCLVQEWTCVVFVCRHAPRLQCILIRLPINLPSLSAPSLTKLIHARASLNATALHIASASAVQLPLSFSARRTHGTRRGVVSVGCGKDEKCSSCIHRSFVEDSTDTTTFAVITGRISYFFPEHRSCHAMSLWMQTLCAGGIW
jgi:hypothetical protein